MLRVAILGSALLVGSYRKARSASAERARARQRVRAPEIAAPAAQSGVGRRRRRRRVAEDAPRQQRRLDQEARQVHRARRARERAAQGAAWHAVGRPRAARCSASTKRSRSTSTTRTARTTSSRCARSTTCCAAAAPTTRSRSSRGCSRSCRTSTITSAASRSRSSRATATSARRPATTTRARRPTSASRASARRRFESFAETLDTGGMGIGLYPRGQFVHIDVRPLPSYRWIDYVAAEPERRREAPAPRLEAQEAAELRALACAEGAGPLPRALPSASRKVGRTSGARCSRC